MNSQSRALNQVAIDNLHNHNIGASDGFDPEQASDLGFEPFDRLVDIIQKQELSPRQVTAARTIGRISCGDCGQVITCRHAGIGQNGKGFTKGY